jgi:hypothetical protein
MSAAAVAVALLLLAGGVVWGCVVDHLRHIDQRRHRDADEHDHHRALMKELRRHDDQQARWRP